MKSDKIYNYIKGYLTVCADGPFTERLINICMHRDFKIWNIKRLGSNRITFNTDINSFKKIRTPARRTKSRVRITKRHGLPFFIRRYRHRKFVIAGAAVLAIMLWYASSHIMGITVFGNSRIDTATILSNLEECGLSLGVSTSKVEPDIVRNQMMTRLEDLAWIGINANGSRVYIEVVERLEKEEGIEKDGTACNLVAARDGEIEHLEVREGQSLVKAGYGVREGDILVSGIVDSSISGFRYVKARGEVFAKTRYSKTRAYPLKYSESIPTGKTKKRYTISVLNHKLPLFFKDEAPYQDFSYLRENKEYRIPIIDMIPSLFISREEFSEQVRQEKQRTSAEAIEIGVKELSEEIQAELPDGVEVIEETKDHTLTEYGEVEVTVEFICRENIAEAKAIEKTIEEDE